MQTIRYQRHTHHQLPGSPGVYQFYSTSGTLIYVGKAKNLKKRVSSYFSKPQAPFIKTQKMIAHIHEIGIILVNDEYDALILENNLIKQHQPRYNILLKDGKTFPFLCLTQEPFPRLIVTRRKQPSKGHYFGPFTSTTQMTKIEELIRFLFPLRTCRYNLSPANIAQKKFKVCLAYHIGNCMGPCEGLQDTTAYDKIVEQVAHILKGNFQTIKKPLKQEMLQAARSKQFQKAQQYKEKLEAIDNYQARSLLIHPRFGDMDVIVILQQNDDAFLSYFHIQKGMLVYAQTVTIHRKLEQTEEDILSRVLLHFREKASSSAKTILTNEAIPTPPTGVKVVIPKIGDRKKLMDLAMKNAFLACKEAQNKKVKQTTAGTATLRLLQKDLKLKQLPLHIECFDNSNLQGTNPVAGMACFKNGRPSKKDYRVFHIRTVIGPDDFASMREVVTRRYQRLIKEKLPLPNLIVIDGGKGQLNIAITALQELGIYDQVAVIAIAKKLESIFLPGDPLPIFISKKSPSLKLIQRIRNAVHDLAIRFHKKTRQKKGLKSELDDIPGFGPQTIRKLYQEFGSIRHMLAASQQELTHTIGPQKTKAFKDYFAHIPQP